MQIIYITITKFDLVYLIYESKIDKAALKELQFINKFKRDYVIYKGEIPEFSLKIITDILVVLFDLLLPLV
jgi:hypothetical protein